MRAVRNPGRARRGLGPLPGVLAAVALVVAPVPAHAAQPPPEDPPGPGYAVDGGNWSGYVATGRSFRAVSARWTEPVVTCTAGATAFASWVGIDGYGSSTVQQTGVATSCSGGRPVHRAWFETVPDPPVYHSFPVHPGDEIAAEVARSGDTYTMTIRNLTRGGSRSVARTSAGAAAASAEIAVEAQQGGFPRFGAVRFTGATVDGAPLDASSATAIDATGSTGFLTSTGRTSGGAFTVRQR
jgi:hypothetical protein